MPSKSKANQKFRVHNKKVYAYKNFKFKKGRRFGWQPSAILKISNCQSLELLTVPATTEVQKMVCTRSYKDNVAFYILPHNIKRLGNTRDSSSLTMSISCYAGVHTKMDVPIHAHKRPRLHFHIL
jgi:hypothetical protein